MGFTSARVSLTHLIENLRSPVNASHFLARNCYSSHLTSPTLHLGISRLDGVRHSYVSSSLSRFRHEFRTTMIHDIDPLFLPNESIPLLTCLTISLLI